MKKITLSQFESKQNPGLTWLEMFLAVVFLIGWLVLPTLM